MKNLLSKLKIGLIGLFTLFVLSSSYLVFLIDPNNRTKYFVLYIDDDGIVRQIVHMDCPPGLWFNYESNVCDFPWHCPDWEDYK